MMERESSSQRWLAEEELSSYLERLEWLMRLRWLALIGVSAAGLAASFGLVPGLNLSVLGLAVTLGVFGNLSIGWRLRRGWHVGEILRSQSLLDTCVLSIVIWAAGGLECPFSSLYVFPVLLSALLAGGRLFWSTVLASAGGLLWQSLATGFKWLRVGRWDPPSPWGDILHLFALTLTVGMVAYFTIRFIDALQRQRGARRQRRAQRRPR